VTAKFTLSTAMVIGECRIYVRGIWSWRTWQRSWIVAKQCTTTDVGVAAYESRHLASMFMPVWCWHAASCMVHFCMPCVHQ